MNEINDHIQIHLHNVLLHGDFRIVLSFFPSFFFLHICHAEWTKVSKCMCLILHHLFIYLFVINAVWYFSSTEGIKHILLHLFLKMVVKEVLVRSVFAVVFFLLYDNDF